MGEAIMREEELEIIGTYVRKHIGDWMKDTSIFSLPAAEVQEPNLIDRTVGEKIVRLEEAIKHQGDLLEKILHQMDRRFEQVDKRFEQVDKRLEQVDKRFEQVDKRFEQVDKRLEQVDKRFEQVDKRFEQVDKRFEDLRGDMNKRFSQLFIFLTVGIGALTTLLSLYQFLG